MIFVAVSSAGVYNLARKSYGMVGVWRERYHGSIKYYFEYSTNHLLPAVAQIRVATCTVFNVDL